MAIAQNVSLSRTEKKLLSFDNKSMRNRSTINKVENFDKVGSINDVPEYGILTGDDGSTWFYTSTYTESEEFPYCYSAVDIDIYDGKSAKVSSIHYDVPAGIKVNYIELFGTVSSKFYDTNTSTKEMTLYVHEVGPDYNTIGHVIVFNTKGEQLKEFLIDNVIWIDASQKWDTYQRAVFVTSGKDSDGNATTVMSVMKPASWSSAEPSVEHVFELRDDLVNYSNGPCMNTYVIGGELYYVLSYYEKPFVSGYDENYDLILAEDNHYLVEIYNKNYEKVKTLSVPVTHPADVYASTYSVGIYSYNDLTRGYYSGDDKLNVVISRNDVRLDTDDDVYPYSFFVYDEEGNFVNTIAENVITWKQLTDIPGESDQMGCICLNDGEETLHMVNMPSCDDQVVFKANVEGNRRISSNYDRYPADGTYQYAIGMGNATSNDNNDVISSIGWFTKDGRLDHYTNFNLGQNGEYFTPLIEGYTLNPSLFNTDSKREYIYIAKLRRTDGSEDIDNVLIISDEDGQEITRYVGQGNENLRVAAVIDTEIGQPRLVVGFYDGEEKTYSIDFYALPFVKFAKGGDGSKDNPYIISSAGDLWQIGKEPNASYELANDIDMSEIAEAWTPVGSFFGQIDGKGNNVDNLMVCADDYYCGLFSYLNEGASLRNITFRNAKMHLTEGNRFAGLVAGMSVKALVDSVYVKGFDVTADADANCEFGGLVGQATYYSTIASDGITGANYDLGQCSIVGGLVGDTRTSTTIDACLFEGKAVAASVLGGIVGATGKGSSVKNNHVKAVLKAESEVGGIVADASRTEVKNNLVEGTLEGNYAVGGILGTIASDWQEGTDKFIVGNIVALDDIIAPDDAKAVHRIAGFTIADEQYEEGETPLEDHGFDQNYASPLLRAYSAKAADSVDGADYEALTRNFLESLGFAYGDSADAPWAEGGSPMLYFEKIWADGIESISTEAHSVGSTLSGLYNLQGQKVAKAEKGIYIFNGKKILVK